MEQEKLELDKQAARALSQPAAQFDRALLLGLESYRTEPGEIAKEAVLSLADSSPHLQRFLSHQEHWVYNLAFDRLDPDIVASADVSGTLTLWQGIVEGDPVTRVWNVDTIVATGICTWTVEGVVLAGHKDWVNSITFSPDGKTLASASQDSRVILWDVEKQLAKETLLGHSEEVVSAVFHPSGNFLLSGELDKRLILWDLTPSAPFTRQYLDEHPEDWTEIICGMVMRPLTDGEWRAFLPGIPIPFKKTCEP